MTKCEYLTARCPYGCEVWLHPKAVIPHADRCRGVPWTESRRPVTEVLLANEDADDARALLPSSVLVKPNISGDRLLNPRPGMRLHDSAVQGIVVRSPLEGITGRRWWTVTRAALSDGSSIDPTFCTERFAGLERSLGLEGHFVRCEVCGDDITPGACGGISDRTPCAASSPTSPRYARSGNSATETPSGCETTAYPSHGPS